MVGATDVMRRGMYCVFRMKVRDMWRVAVVVVVVEPSTIVRGVYRVLRRGILLRLNW